MVSSVYRRSSAEVPAPPRHHRTTATPPPGLLRLQSAAGNRAVARLVVQRCGPTPCDCPPEEREAKEAAPVQRVAADFRVTGKSPKAATDQRSIYFDYESSTVTAPDDTKFAAFAGVPMSTVRLKGTASEEERRGPGRAALVDDRIAAVSGPLAAGSPGTGNPTPQPDLSPGGLDYRSARRVEILVAGQQSTAPVCVPSPDISCGPSPNAFDTAHARAVALLANARNALATPNAAPAVAPLTALFHGPANAAAVDSGLAKIEAHMGNMLPAIPLHDATAGGHRCINSCLGDDYLASNHGSGNTARMTLGPKFLNEPDVTERALVLIHEGSHGATGLITSDKAYRWQRLMAVLSLPDALDNADSYTRLVALVDNPAVAPASQVDDTSALTGGGQGAAAAQAMAWLEQWLVQGRLEVRSLYDHAGRAIAAGAWQPASVFYRDHTMTYLVADFGLTAPPAVPVADDREKIAGIFDRLYTLRKKITGRGFRFTTGGYRWSAGPGATVRLSSGFFGLSPRDQVKRLLRMAVSAAPFIEAGRKDHYTRLVRRMSDRWGP
ncbi:hypothetical protein [Saccharothrix sp.]|uniref:hypothetical protein n=1 Tax=Saccharothrix sp. TaxID=1873460 RepID=UPI002811AFB8|nr:hypothetical protein [Saccharothrix sp.]